MRKLKEKVNLWFSQEKAQKGKYYFIPIDDGKKVVKCTGITLDNVPPSNSSVFLSTAYLPIIRKEI
jgi:hypothetical protein